jgi:site-specific DNA recombinase
MRAAVYARKSTDDDDKGEDNKSVTRQVDHARAYASSKGWEVSDDLVFTDDNVSGAEFKNRPGLLRMLTRLREFDVIVMSELSRLGRDQVQTAQVLAQVEAAGVQVHFYLTKEQLRFETAVDRFLVGAVSFAAELEREKAGQRARDALLRKAKAGHSTGGLVYGYDRHRCDNHTEWRINAEQAAVIVGIYSCYRDGYGHACIAKTLNGVPRYANLLAEYFNGVAPPRPRQGNRGTGSWSASAIYEILHCERYGGIIPFGEYRTVYKGGTATTVRQKEFLRVERPELRIVPEPLWAAVQARLAAVRASYLRTQGGKLFGRPERGTTARHLLSGLLHCGACGASMTATGVPLEAEQPGAWCPTTGAAPTSSAALATTANRSRRRPSMGSCSTRSSTKSSHPMPSASSSKKRWSSWRSSNAPSPTYALSCAPSALRCSAN